MRHRRNPKIAPLTRRTMQRDNGTNAERRTPPRLRLDMEVRLRDGTIAKLKDIDADGVAYVSVDDSPAWIAISLADLV